MAGTTAEAIVAPCSVSPWAIADGWRLGHAVRTEALVEARGTSRLVAPGESGQPDGDPYGGEIRRCPRRRGAPIDPEAGFRALLGAVAPRARLHVLDWAG